MRTGLRKGASRMTATGDASDTVCYILFTARCVAFDGHKSCTETRKA
jgi:hypothetical protein